MPAATESTYTLRPSPEALAARREHAQRVLERRGFGHYAHSREGWLAMARAARQVGEPDLAAHLEALA